MMTQTSWLERIKQFVITVRDSLFLNIDLIPVAIFIMVFVKNFALFYFSRTACSLWHSASANVFLLDNSCHVIYSLYCEE